MKIVFSSIKNSVIFDDSFQELSEQNGTIEFKKKGLTDPKIAVIYAPNGTGKSSFASLLEIESSSDNNYFKARNEKNVLITPESKSFHVIKDQICRNVIRGKTTDYLMGEQIRREYELRDNINSAFKNAYDRLLSIYKTEFKLSTINHYLLHHLKSLQEPVYQKAFQYIQNIVNKNRRGKNIDRNSFVAFIRNEENRRLLNEENIPQILELNEEKKSFIISDLSKAKIITKILSINPDEVVANANVILVEQHDDAIFILNKYHSADSCIVCDNPSFNGDELLERKKEHRKNIYDDLDAKTKDILDKIVCDSSINISDPFDIKKIVGSFITDADSTSLLELQQELMTFINIIAK